MVVFILATSIRHCLKKLSSQPIISLCGSRFNYCWYFFPSGYSFAQRTLQSILPHPQPFSSVLSQHLASNQACPGGNSEASGSWGPSTPMRTRQFHSSSSILLQYPLRVLFIHACRLSQDQDAPICSRFGAYSNRLRVFNPWYSPPPVVATLGLHLPDHAA